MDLSEFSDGKDLSKLRGGACDLGFESFKVNRRQLKMEQRDACDYHYLI